MVCEARGVAFSAALSLVSTRQVHVWAAPVFSLIRSSMCRGRTLPLMPVRPVASSVTPSLIYGLRISRVIARWEPSSSVQLRESSANIS